MRTLTEPIHLPDDLLERARRRARREGRTLSDLLADGLARLLEEDGEPAGHERPTGQRRLPRVSSRSGRVRAGVGLASNAALRDLMDEGAPLGKRR